MYPTDDLHLANVSSSVFCVSVVSSSYIIIHVIAPQLSAHCGVISNRLWRHQQNENRASETRGRWVKLVVLYSFMDSLCRIRNKIMYVLSWRTISTLTWGLFWYLFPSLLRNSGNKHHHNTLVNAETIRHSSAYIIPYVFWFKHVTFTHHHHQAELRAGVERIWW